MYNRKDFYLVALIGFLVGWLVLRPAKNVGIEITIPVAVALIAGFTIFALTALFVLKLLSRKFTVFEGGERNAGFSHWYVDVRPVLNLPAGFEYDTGIEVNVIDPDIAAKILKDKS